MARIKLHVHLGGRVRTVDLSPPTLKEQYEDLTERLMAALSLHATTDAKRAAGVASFDPKGRVLLLRRRADCKDHPGEWSFPAGTIEPGENAEQCARREMREETRWLVSLLHPFGTYKGDTSHFTCFRANTPAFVPLLCQEHDGWAWASLKDLPEPTHPGVLALLQPGSRTTDDAEQKDPNEGHWLTINGAHVFVNGKGDITKGPAHMIGANTSALQEKPKPIAAKGVKGIVHALLSGGQQFHFDDLKQATGAKLDQQLHNAINELKAGKGPAGQLMIEKVGPKLYQVVNAKTGEPVPGVKPPDIHPDLENDPLFKDFKLDPPKTAVKSVDPATPPIPLAEPPKTQPAADPAPSQPDSVSPEQAEVPKAPAGPPGTPPATPMTKAEADKEYDKTLMQLCEEAALEGTAAPDDYLKQVAKEWKQGKADAMAQWAANVHGTKHESKPVEVFPEDINLVKALVAIGPDGDGAQYKEGQVKKAISDWKSATAQAKNKPKASATPAEPEAKPKPQAIKIPTGPSKMPDVHPEIVSADHKHVEPEDFAGGSSSPFVKGINELKSTLVKQSNGSVDNKKVVQAALEKRLVQSHYFQHLQEMHKKNGEKSHGGSLVAKLISCWAGSSGDSNAGSVAAQAAVKEVFNMGQEHLETKALSHDLSDNLDSVWKMGAQYHGFSAKTPEEVHAFKEGLKDFVKAQYHETQAQFKELGITEMHLVRGMHIGSSTAAPSKVRLKLQPASSFSTNLDTARSFGSGGSIYAVKVPVSAVLGSYITGYGCSGEHEVVVLNHHLTDAIKIGHSKTAHLATMAHEIHSTLGSGGSAPASPTAPKKDTAGGLPQSKWPSLPSAKLNSGWQKKIQSAMAEGDVAKMKALHAELHGSWAGLPNTKAYATQALQALKAHKALAGITPTVTVKKNAYYYKKLKNSILQHPEHTEAGYKAAKAKGLTNEQILAEYQKVAKANKHDDSKY